MYRTVLVCCIFVILQALFCQATDCDEDRLKIYIKINDTLWDEYETYLLRATVAYSVQKFCGNKTDTLLNTYEYDCNDEGAANADTDTTSATNETARISYCIKVENVDVETVRVAIKESKANMNGALILTEEDLVVDGILPTLEPPITYDFEPWLIVYIVFTSLVVLAGLLIMYFSFRPNKHHDKLGSEFGDEEDDDEYVKPNEYVDEESNQRDGTNSTSQFTHL